MTSPAARSLSESDRLPLSFVLQRIGAGRVGALRRRRAGRSLNRRRGGVSACGAGEDLTAVRVPAPNARESAAPWAGAAGACPENISVAVTLPCRTGPRLPDLSMEITLPSSAMRRTIAGCEHTNRFLR